MSIIEFLSQPLWQRLGLTLVHFLWQGLAIAIFIGACVRIFKLSHGNARYIVYLLAFVAMIVCPVVTFIAIDIPISPDVELFVEIESAEPFDIASDTVPPEGAVSPEAGTSIPVMPKLTPVTNTIPIRERIYSSLHNTLPWLLVIWMVGVIVLSMRLLMGFIGVHRWRHHLEPLPERLVQRIASLSKELGMRGFSSVFISPSVLQAMAVGYLRPMVLLPAALVIQMQPEMLEAIIAHELAHIRRFDLWVNLAQRVMETLLFYHPAVWWLSNRLRNERELCCDELAVRATGERLTYVTALENASRFRLIGKQPDLAVGLGQDDQLILNRVRHVLGIVPAPRSSRFWLAGIITFLFLAALTLLTATTLTAKVKQKADVQIEASEIAGPVMDEMDKPITLLPEEKISGRVVDEMDKPITLLPEEKIAGFVEDKNGSPIAGASVTLLNKDLVLLPKPQKLGETMRMEITGQVQDYQTRKVEGADIAIFEIHRDDYYSPTSVKLLDKLKKTDHEGRFVFNIMATPYHDIYVIARKEGLALGWDYIHKKRIYEAKPGNNFIDIVLPKPYTLAGRLVDSGGKLVAGANVQVFTRKGEIVCEPKDWFSVKTDSKGRFVFDNLPIDLMVKFYIEVPNMDIAYIYPPRGMEGNACGGYHVDWEDVELKLPPVTTVWGQVIDKDTGQGLKDMGLLIFTSEGAETEWRFRSCVRYTLTNGEFEIKGVPPGKHILRFISPKTGPDEWAGKNVPITVNRGDKNVRTKILVEKGVPLEVIVRDPTTGKALPYMKVQVFDGRWNYHQEDIFIRETRADANGIAHIMVPQGRYMAHAWGGNYETRMNFKGAEVNIAGSRAASVEILVKPRVPFVRGTVVDTQGQPAKNVYIIIGLGQRVLTDNNGWFEGMQSPLYPSHMVVARDIKNNLAGANYFYNALRELRVVLRPGSSIRGRVTDDMGRGIAGANVNITLNSKNGTGTAHLDTAGTRTDSEGYYCLETVVPLRSGFHYHLSFDATEFGPTRYTLTDRMKPGEEVTIPDMKLVTLDAFISGVVLDENDNPVAHKPVFVGSDSGGAHIGRGTSTDEQGRFKFNRIPEGPVTLQSGFGQGPDAAYIYAHSGDNVPIKLGNHFKNFMPPFSLVGSQLPDLRVLEMGFDYQGFKNKKNLVVFVDYTNRSSEIAIDLLKKRQLDLRRSKIEVVCIQVVPVDEGDLVAWKKGNKISFPIYILPGQSGWDSKNNLLILKQTPKIMNTLRQEWGVRSLPWTILTDENQKILATGLNIPRILHMVYEEERLSPLRNNPIGRRRR